MQTIGISAFPNIIVVESCDYIIAEVIICAQFEIIFGILKKENYAQRFRLRMQA